MQVFLLRIQPLPPGCSKQLFLQITWLALHTRTVPNGRPLLDMALQQATFKKLPGGSSKSLKLNYHMIQQPHSYVRTQEKEHTPTQKPVHQRSQQHYSQSPKGGNDPNVHRRMKGSTKCGTSVQWNIIQPLKIKR